MIERLRGTSARLRERTLGLVTELLTWKPAGGWSIRENVGHLADLEPLWAGRLGDLVEGREELRPADLENRATEAARHNEGPLTGLLQSPERLRADLTLRLEFLSEDEVRKMSRHPRLRRPMTTIELCVFLAEHDDHHLALITEIIKLGTKRTQ